MILAILVTMMVGSTLYACCVYDQTVGSCCEFGIYGYVNKPNIFILPRDIYGPFDDQGNRISVPIPPNNGVGSGICNVYYKESGNPYNPYYHCPNPAISSPGDFGDQCGPLTYDIDDVFNTVDCETGFGTYPENLKTEFIQCIASTHHCVNDADNNCYCGGAPGLWANFYCNSYTADGLRDAPVDCNTYNY